MIGKPSSIILSQRPRPPLRLRENVVRLVCDRNIRPDGFPRQGIGVSPLSGPVLGASKRDDVTFLPASDLSWANPPNRTIYLIE